MKKFQQILRTKSSLLYNKGIQMILQNNKIWSKYKIQEEPDYFKKLTKVQTPKFLWIGCSDSRVPANQITGLKPGELFVHRNVANVVSPSDINILAVIQFAVQQLKVEDIIVTGHYNCGGVKACFSKHDHGPLEAWLSHLRQTRAHHHDQLQQLKDFNLKIDRLVELNVKHQVLNVARIPIIQQTWKNKQILRIHGLVYRLEDGILKDLGISIDRIQNIPQQHRIIE